MREENTEDARDIRYALSKQLHDDHAPLTISTDYGEIPLTHDDRVAVRKLLRRRFEANISV